MTQRFEKRPPVEFYDVQKDPDELHNLAKDPAYVRLIEIYRQDLQAWMTQQNDTGAALDVVYPQKEQP